MTIIQLLYSAISSRSRSQHCCLLSLHWHQEIVTVIFASTRKATSQLLSALKIAIYFSVTTTQCAWVNEAILPKDTDMLQGCKWPNMIGPENMRSVASAASGALAPHGRGSRGPLKGPGGVQGQSPWRGSRGQRPRKLTHFEHFKAILDAFPGSTGALQASTQRGNCFVYSNLFYHKLRNLNL